MKHEAFTFQYLQLTYLHGNSKIHPQDTKSYSDVQRANISTFSRRTFSQFQNFFVSSCPKPPLNFVPTHQRHHVRSSTPKSQVNPKINRPSEIAWQSIPNTTNCSYSYQIDDFSIFFGPAASAATSKSTPKKK